MLIYCIRIINIAQYNCNTNDIFYQNKILELNDIIQIEQLHLAFTYINNTIPMELLNLFRVNVNRYNTRNMEMGSLQVPNIKKVCYGERTLRYSVPTIMIIVTGLEKFFSWRTKFR